MLLVILSLVLAGAAALWWFERNKLNGNSPLINAVTQYRMVSLYMKYAGRRDHDGWTALMHAVYHADARYLEQLVYAEARLQDKYGNTALMYATGQGLTRWVATLIAAGEARIRNNLGHTALMRAAAYGQHRCMAALIEAGEARMRDKRSDTALMRAAENGHHRCVVALIEAGEACMRDRLGGTALMVAATNGYHKCCHPLIAAGEAGMRNNAGVTALMFAARDGQAEIGELLIAAGENPYAIDPETHRVPAELFGLKCIQPAALQMQCLRHIYHGGRRVGLWHPDLPPMLRVAFYTPRAVT